MTRSETIVLALTWVAGAALGALFFGGLWWTTRRGLASRHAAAWFLGSLVLRAGVVMAGFLLVSDGRWQRMLACLLGFGMARWVVLRLTRPAIASATHPAEEAQHAPHAR